MKQLLLAGGVAANQGLRERLIQEVKLELPETELIIPPLALCGDNAAMIAAGTVSFLQGKRSGFDMNANPGLLLEDI